VKVGITLPTFRDDTSALEVARKAEGLGIDGVFVYDHVWPIGRPDRPALSSFPVLGAVAASTARVRLGPLVARVGLTPDRQLVDSFRTLQIVSRGRLIAGLGTGDRLNEPENLAFGVPYPAAAVRRQNVEQIARVLIAQNTEVWIGGSAPSTIAVAIDSGATVNLWDVDVRRVADQAQHGPVTWGGPTPGDLASLTELLDGMREAGAKWTVLSAPSDLDDVARAVRSTA
jgi:hypothetical protein